MHARYWNETMPIPEEFLENKPAQRSPVELPAATQPREILDIINKQSYQEVLHKPKNLYKEILKDIFDEDKFGDLSRIEDKPFNLAEELARDNAREQANFNPLDKLRKEKIPLDISVDYDYSKGLKLTILALRNFKMCSRFQITGGLMDGDEFVLDENAQDCVFGTKSKMLTDLFTYKIDRTMEEGSEFQDSVEDDNIPVETMIAFNEVFYFLRNIPGLILMKQNNLSINLVFQVIGIDEDGQPLRNKSTYDKYSKLRQPNDDEEDDNMPRHQQSSQNNFSFVCWYAVKLNRINGRIIEGRFIEPLYKPPMVKPPLENKDVQSTAARIEFIIEEYIYTANTLKEHKLKQQESSMNAIKKQLKPSPKKPVPTEKSDVFNRPAESDDLKQQFKDAMIKPAVQLIFKPFIENRKVQFTNRLFEKGSGIDIYIDAARFLPDNVTVSKVIILEIIFLIPIKVYFNVYTQDALPIIKAQHSISDLESNCFSPNFKLKVELRAAYFSPTCIAVLSIETIDRSNEEVRTIGYSAFNLFLGYHTNQPPISDSETVFFL